MIKIGCISYYAAQWRYWWGCWWKILNVIVFPSEWRHNMFFATAGCCFSRSQSFAFLGGRRKTQCFFFKFIFLMLNAFVNVGPFKPRPTQAYIQGEVQWVKQRKEKKSVNLMTGDSPVQPTLYWRAKWEGKWKWKYSQSKKRKAGTLWKERKQMFFRGTSKSKSISGRRGRFFSFSVSISFPTRKWKWKSKMMQN